MSLARPAPATTTGDRLLPEVPKSQRRSGLSAMEAFRIALQGLGANKLRSFLTMLGVVFGVGSVVAMLSVGEGASQKAMADIRKQFNVPPGRREAEAPLKRIDHIERELITACKAIGVDLGADWGHKLDLTEFDN